MSDLEMVKEFQKNLENFKILTKDLDNNLSELKVIIRSEKFIPDSLNKIIQNNLEEISIKQKNFSLQYKKLEGAELPESFSETEEILHKHKRKIEIKEKYAEAIQFFMHLSAEDDKTKNLLEQKKQELLKLDLDCMTEEEIKENVQKYVWLLEAYEESNPVKRFSLVYRLSSCFEEEIAMNVQFHTFIILEDNKEIVKESETKLQKQKEATTNLQALRVTEEAENLQDLKAEEINIQEQKEATTNLQALNASEETNIQKQKAEITNLQALNASEKMNIQEQKEATINLQALNASEETNIQEQKEATTNLQALNASEETNIQEQKEETENLQNLSAAEESENLQDLKEEAADSEFWEKIKVENAEEIIVKEDTSLLKIETSAKANTKFGVKEFKKEITKNFPIEKMNCLMETLDSCGYTIESLAIWRAEKPTYYELATERLFQLGYLKKYFVQGYGEFYTLSPRGEKAFTSKESILFINHHLKEKKKFFLEGEHIEDKTNSAINRLLSFGVFSRILQITEAYLFVSRKLYIGTDFFFYSFPNVIGSKSVIFFGITTENPAEFEEAYQYLKEQEKEMEEETEEALFIVAGITRELAFHLAKWVSAIMEQKLSICYYGYSDTDIYDFATQKAIDKSKLKKDAETLTEDAPVKEEENFAEDDFAEEGEEKSFTEEENFAEDDLAEEGKENSTEESLIKEEYSIEKENPIEKIREDFAGEDFVTEEAPTNKGKESFIKEKNIAANLDIDKEKHDMAYQKMLVDSQFYAAVAYVKALSQKIPYYETVYHQLAYALNDPMEECSYCSDSIFSIYYYEEAPISEHYVVAAAIRNYFLDQYNYDYGLQQLQTTLSGNRVLCDNPALSKVVYTLQQFKINYHSGIDRYADYREKERTSLEKRLEEIRRDAKGYFENYCLGNVKEAVPNRRFVETSKLLLGLNSELSEYLQIVIRDDRDMLELLEDFLVQNYIKENAMVCEENLDHEKINSILETYWELSAQNMRYIKKTSDLMSSLRMNLYKRVKKVVGVLCDYVFLMKSSIISKDNAALCAYKKLYVSLLKDIHEAKKNLVNTEDMELSQKAGNAVILVTLQELEARLVGNYKEGSNKFFYINFLKNDKVLLDEDFFPVLEDVLELPDFYITNRIVQHCKEEECSWETRLQEIFHGEDDYGSAELILIYLRMENIALKNVDISSFDVEKAVIFPRKDTENKRKEFMEDLELAQSYGQIDNTVENRKETMIQIMDIWYLRAIDTQNYGFFYKILAAFREKIKKDAQVHAVELEQSLEIYLEENPEWKDDTLIYHMVNQIRDRIKQQNYAAAEDLFNRLLTKDFDLDIDFEQTDYLEEFIEEYDSNYRRTANPRETLKSLLYGSKINKDTKGGDRLLENWPKGAGFGESALMALLSTLGFIPATIQKEEPIQDKIKSFFVMLKRPQNGRKSNYKHPISAFGSEAEEKGFRVACIFGKTDASRLIDTFKEIGNAKHTIVLLDYALTLADRRTLARKTKTDLTGKIFAVIDRVVLVYLAKHYTETAINRMLMSVIMPFASYQPYIDKSADVMPQELFIGRKNELEKIESPTGVNIVYGGRQLGKTALLRMAQKDIDMNENGDRAIIVSVREKDYHATAKAISEALYDEKILKEENITEDWGELARDIKNRLRDETDPIPYLLLMIDEADTFIESCEEIGYQPFDELKNIQGIGSGRFKFVVAGLHNIVRLKRTAALGKNRVLTHLDSLTVKPFRSMEARELLEVPLSYLGFRFPKDNETEVLISTIFGTTNYFPGLIQLYCIKMIEAMKRDYAGYSESETPPYIVRKEHIKKALADQTLLKDIREKFDVTLGVGDDDYYYIIALLIARHYHENKSQNGCSVKDLSEISKSLFIWKLADMEEEKIFALMEEMCELNILQHTGEGRYRFARHNFLQMMGTTQQIDNGLMKYMED